MEPGAPDDLHEIGGYRLGRRLGRGAMGIVYEGEDVEGNGVAIKVLSGELAASDEFVERFRREATAASDFNHPNITRVFGFGDDGERLYMAMELLLGRDLKSLLESGEAGSLAERVRLMAEVAAGMSEVHARGLVHRDLKPANIHVTPEGTAKIMDFGLVRLSDSDMTRTGMVMGSPAYMAPEQLRGEHVDARCDVFSLGAVFYELLTGKRAFPGKRLTDVMMSVMGAEPPPLSVSAPDAPAPVALVVARCLRKDAKKRYRSAGELHAALEVLEAAYRD